MILADIYFERTANRPSFVDKYFRVVDLDEKVKDLSVLVKPNIVSYEPYPTTTHPETLREVIKHLQHSAKRTVVGDGKAFDCDTDITQHPLALECKSLNVEFVDFSKTEMKTVRTESGFDLEISRMMFDFDVVISLPVLKYNFTTGLTGALKNQYGFLSDEEKKHLHLCRDKNIHRAIAELSRIRKPDFYVVDAVQTMICAQELRHGGRVYNDLGIMFAGTDPVSLDSYGFEILKDVEKRLRKVFRKAKPEQILHLKYAIDFGVGKPDFDLKGL